MKRYRTIVADPPWRYEGAAKALTAKRDRRAQVADFYSTMTHTEIAALPVAALADDDAHLYLWVTNTLLFDVRDGIGIPEIVQRWGFTYKTLLTWDKTGPLGLGRYFRGRTEHVVFATRGALAIPPTSRRSNIIHAPNGAHSVKPDAFYDLVEQVSPEPRVEMFARRARLSGWDYWGDESLGTAAMPEAAA